MNDLNEIREWLNAERSCIKHVQKWLDSTTRSVKDCCKKPCREFLKTEKNVLRHMNAQNGSGYKVLTCSFYFECAYIYQIGYRRRIRVISKYPLEDCYTTDYTLPGIYTKGAVSD